MPGNITSLQKFVHTGSGCCKTWTNIFLQSYNPFCFSGITSINCDKVEWHYLKNWWVYTHDFSVLIIYLHSYKVEVLLQTKKNLNVLANSPAGSIQWPSTLAACKPEEMNPGESDDNVVWHTYTWFSFWALKVWSLWNGVVTAILWPHIGVEVSAGLSRFRFSWLDEVFKNCR